MKVAVSVLEPVFEAAQRVSKQMRIPRRQLHSKAIAAFVQEHSRKDVTKSLKAVCRKASAAVDPAWEGVSLDVLRREKW